MARTQKEHKAVDMLRKPPICGMGSNYRVTSPPTFVKFFAEIPFPRPQQWKNTFSKFISVFSGNRRKTSHEETCGEVSPFSDNVLYNLHSQVSSERFSTIIEPSICAQFCQYLLRI